MSRKKKKPTKSRIDTSTILINGLVDLTVGLAIALIVKAFNL